MHTKYTQWEGHGRDVFILFFQKKTKLTGFLIVLNFRGNKVKINAVFPILVVSLLRFVRFYTERML